MGGCLCEAESGEGERHPHKFRTLNHQTHYIVLGVPGSSFGGLFFLRNVLSGFSKSQDSEEKRLVSPILQQ